MTDRSLGTFPSTHLLSQRSIWYQALTLTERLNSLRTSAAREEARAHASGDLGLAERRLQKWKTQFPFEQPSYFAERLALDAITEEDLRTLLGEPIEVVQARTIQPPEWLSVLIQAFAVFDPTQGVVQPSLEPDQKLMNFLDPIAPLLKHGFERLQTGIQNLSREYPLLPFQSEVVVSLLFPNIVGRILPVLVRTLTLELHVARLREQLQGETPEERFHSFIRYLCKPGTMMSLLEMYPVLARLLVIILDQGVNYGLELLEHLCTDWHEIRTYFTPKNDPGVLTNVQFGAGDTHRHGRSVIRLEFKSGFNLIYKPRSLSVDIHFQDLLTWLNTQGDHPPLRSVQVLNKGSYGWSEYVEAQSCASSEEVARFYERLGSYLAVMYVFEATDLHFENVIACGEHPMLVDLETLFQPYFPRGENKTIQLPQGTIVLNTSVSRAGLLPARIWANANREGVDLSGLGGKEGQLTPYPVARLTEIGTDQMRMVRQRNVIQGQQNRPMLNGEAIETLDYLDQVMNGFRKIYHLLQQHREELITFILPKFSQDEIRVVLRPTRTYARLLQESLHPAVLHNALERNRLFDHLWATVPRAPHLVKVITAEIKDLEEHNIPFFTTRPDTCDLYTGLGEPVANFFYESGLTTVEQKIRQLNEQDLSRQCWIIQASFASVEMGREQTTWRNSHLLPTSRQLSYKRLMKQACIIGDRLCELAIFGENEISWLNLYLVGERRWSLSITGLDLYNGAVGIGFFLAYLGRITGEEKYTSLARRAAAAINHQIDAIAPGSLTPGGFTGWGALVYFYTHLGVLWQEPALLAKAEALIKRFSDSIEKDEVFDMLGGSAGSLRALVSLYRITPSSHILDAALRCGNHLLARATPMLRGVGWFTPLAEGQPLTGYSHGAAGIALSLLELATVSGEERYQHLAIAAMEYERGVFSSEKQNWPDLRELEAEGKQQKQEQSFMVTWCHGAPGIGLARLASLAYLDDVTIREEIEIALKTTLLYGFGMNHSLCHGDMGNLDILLTASQLLQDERYKREVTHLAAMILDSIEREGWSTGVPLGVETPGLMLGIAGIGYELLRLARPDWVPSVLLLASPCLASLR